MSIPIPIILALVAQKNNQIRPQTKKAGTTAALVPSNNSGNQQLNRARYNKNMISKLNGVAQIVGGSRGAKISNVANIMNSVSSHNPMNILSLVAKSRIKSPMSNLLSGQSMPNLNGASNIYNNINNMLNNMDEDKKDELMSMAQSIMKPNN